MERLVSHAIINAFFRELSDAVDADVAIVGGGPSGLVAAWHLARAGYAVNLFERKLAPGGGMWGGAMLFNRIVVQAEAMHLVRELGIRHQAGPEGTWVLDSVEATATLIVAATRAGARVFNGMSVEDVALDDRRAVAGVVVNWAPVSREKLHVDPLVFTARAVIDGTGHDCEVARVLERKNGVRLATTTGGVIGENSLHVVDGEAQTVEHTGEVYPGLYICGMAANGVSGGPRMGPIFGGMLLSGEKVAGQIAARIGAPRPR